MSDIHDFKNNQLVFLLMHDAVREKLECQKQLLQNKEIFLKLF